MGVSGTTARDLRSAGHDVVHLREVGLKKMPDSDILAKARAENRILLTFDLGFGELGAASGEALPSVISFRLSDERPSAVTPRLFRVITERRADLEAGAIISVEMTRYRVRHLPIDSSDR